ncbi:hypothetical protein BHM03_00003407 [Ensete ventricosum]|uniref:Uncharacterized protein n=1 Tax=Ensete ventricosum TaxID=4639 RepID=A0A445MA07_ENSVE|nr:hypothetical protein BHM03_00003407 [Ensete ventricosum]
MGADRALRALSIISFTISSKGSEYPTNTRVQMDISNKSGIYRSICETMKYTCANMKQYDANINIHNLHSDGQRIKNRSTQKIYVPI